MERRQDGRTANRLVREEGRLDGLTCGVLSLLAVAVWYLDGLDRGDLGLKLKSGNKGAGKKAKGVTRKASGGSEGQRDWRVGGVKHVTEG